MTMAHMQNEYRTKKHLATDTYLVNRYLKLNGNLEIEHLKIEDLAAKQHLIKNEYVLNYVMMKYMQNG